LSTACILYTNPALDARKEQIGRTGKTAITYDTGVAVNTPRNGKTDR
jgi:hypothetical protein